MLLNFSTALRNARLNAIISTLDAGTANASFKFYSGTKPATTGGAITSQVLLGTCALSKPCATVTTGVLTFESITDDPVADDTGVITWARALDGDGNFVMDMDCGIDGTNAMIIFGQTSVQAGGVIRVTAGTLTEGNL